MKWKGRRQSHNVIDSRGKKVAQTAGAGVLLNFVGRRFGLKGILVMLAVVGVLWITGLVDPSAFLGGGGEGCRALYNEIEGCGHCGVKEMGHGGHSILIEGNYIHHTNQPSVSQGDGSSASPVLSPDGGTIAFDSVVGQGTTFSISLPLAAQPVPTGA